MARVRTPLDPASPGRPGGAGQSAGGAYPNAAGGKPFEGGQSDRDHYGGGQLGERGPNPNAATQGDEKALTSDT